jgi:hypothetical protein
MRPASFAFGALFVPFSGIGDLLLGFGAHTTYRVGEPLLPTFCWTQEISRDFYR